MTEPSRTQKRSRTDGKRPDPARHADGRRPEQDLPRPVAIRLAWARIAMTWERFWPALWPALALLGLFLSLSFLDVWAGVPLTGQALILFALLAAALYLTWRNLSRTRVPERREGLRRLESDSGLKHRPLSSLQEKPAADADPKTRALWQAHRKRLAAQASQAGVVWPRTDAPRHDPYALRLLLILIFGLSVVIAGTDIGPRLRTALAPLLGPGVPANVELDAWIEPPAYTNLPPITLVRGYRPGANPQGAAAQHGEDGAIKPQAVPVGSTLVVRLTGFDGRPLINLKPDERPGPDASWPAAEFSRDGSIVEGRAAITMPLNAEVVLRGETLGRWHFTVGADEPPVVEMPLPPMATNTASVRFFYTIGDDYGVTRAHARITLVPETPEEVFAAETAGAKPAAVETDPALAEDVAPSPWPDAATPVTVELPVSLSGAGVREETAIENLASHPWAGRDVLVQIGVEDAVGQSAFSEAARIELPERIFLDPFAQSLVELRSALAKDPDLNAYRVAAALEALTGTPDQFIDDSMVYLGLRSAYWRLSHDPRPSNVRDVFDLMWDIALRVEDGDLSDSLQRLRQVQRALEAALEREAPAAEIRQLMAQLKAALDQYLADLMNEADTRAADPNAPAIGSDDLSSLMDSIQQLAEMGAHGQARQMLAELQQLLENLRPSAGSGGSGGNGETSPQVQALNEALADLSDIISDQQQLLDRTYRESNQGEGSSLYGLPEDGPMEAFRRALEGQFGTDNNNPIKRRLLEEFANRPPGSTPDADNQQSPGAPSAVGSGDRDGGALARDQQALRDRLGTAQGELEGSGLETPGTLGDAGSAMESSRDDLNSNAFSEAFKDQQAALDALRATAEALAQEALRRQGRQGGTARRDPLGRDQGQGGLATQGGVRIPDQSEIQRAREILDELRRRSSERTRPETELDYFDRLLRQF